MIYFVIEGPPVGKERPRGVPTGRGKVRMYTPEKTRLYEDRVAELASRAMHGQPALKGACSVVMEIYFPIPASWSQAKRLRALQGLEMPTVKPDVDNIEKAIKDACNEVVWDDDAQVVEVLKRKRYSANPRIHVTIAPVTSMEPADVDEG